MTVCRFDHRPDDPPHAPEAHIRCDGSDPSWWEIIFPLPPADGAYALIVAAADAGDVSMETFVRLSGMTPLVMRRQR